MSKRNENTPNNSEWQGLQGLWAESPLTLMQLVRRLNGETGWAKSTVTTLLSRMEQKGFIRYRDGGKAREYYPLVTREEVALAETESLLSRVYNGSVGMMVNALVRQNNLSKEEISELYDILERAEKND